MRSTTGRIETEEETREKEEEEEGDEKEDEERTDKQTPAVSCIVFLSFSIFAPSSSAFIPSFSSSLFLLVPPWVQFAEPHAVDGNPSTGR